MDQITKAIKLFGQGYMCSQAVFAAFSEQFGITEKQALKIGGCFGGGMNKGEVCGACTGALMVLGMRYGQVDLNDFDSRMAENAKAVQWKPGRILFMPTTPMEFPLKHPEYIVCDRFYDEKYFNTMAYPPKAVSLFRKIKRRLFRK